MASTNSGTDRVAEKVRRRIELGQRGEEFVLRACI